MVYYILSALAALIVLIALSTRDAIKIKSYKIESGKVEQSIRFAALSDLHGGKYGNNQKELLEIITQSNVDAILMPGDIIDDRKRNSNEYGFCDTFGKSFDCYYSSGNHEHRRQDFDLVVSDIEKSGIKVLMNKSEIMKKGNTVIQIFGLTDKEAYSDEKKPAQWQEKLEKLSQSVDKKHFSILLSHRPEFAEDYATTDFDLIVSGHAHGGQIRLPFINGIYAPGQGLFPKYAGGRYDLKKGNVLIVGRGLSKDHIPRIFNRPELVLIDIVPSVG